MNTRIAVLVSLLGLVAVSQVAGDTYVHNPRGSNNRLNERSANRNNGNRVFDSQNNNRGGYNKGDTKVEGGFAQNNEQFDFTYFMSTRDAFYNDAAKGKSILTVEWTNQHGCGGNEHDDPHKLNCNIVLQYMCEPDHDVVKSVSAMPREDCGMSCQIPSPLNPDCQGKDPVACSETEVAKKEDCEQLGLLWRKSYANDEFNCPHECVGASTKSTSKKQCEDNGGAWTGDTFDDGPGCDDPTKPCLFPRDGLNTNTQDFTGTAAGASQATRLNTMIGNVKIDRVLMEKWEYYDECNKRHRNRGLFTADQNLRGNTAKYTRQNPNGARRGYECPEERDHYPYWHPTPWRDIVIMTDRLDKCPHFQAESYNVRPKNLCRNTQACQDCVKYNNAKQCKEHNGNWVLIDSHNIPPPKCIQAPWSRVNHLGNGRFGQPNTYNWTLPFVGEEGGSGVQQRCVFRLRYNMTTDDYNGDVVNASFNNNNGANVKSPIQQNPNMEVGSQYHNSLRLAINTAQTGRTFQDRSHVFILKPRLAEFGDRTIYNLNVRGKRANIVQAFPAVEYDYVPNRLHVSQEDLIHIQWAGSNTHNNGNPAGDGQAGDAGEGTRGTDRHNMVEMSLTMAESFPTTWEKSTLFKNLVKAWSMDEDNKDAIAVNDNDSNRGAHWSMRMATVGHFPEKKIKARAEGTEPEGFNNLLNNARASYNAGVFMFSKGKYMAMCTRNHNFSNRDQKLYLTIE